jgi:hypothetical protein
MMVSLAALQTPPASSPALGFLPVELPQNKLPSPAAKQTGRNPGCISNSFPVLLGVDYLATDRTCEKSEFAIP